jgi:hypothetical protein
MHASCLLEVIVYAIGNLIVLSRTLESILAGPGHPQVMLGCAGVGVLLSAVPDNAYSYVSLVSCCSIAVAASMVLASGWEMPTWARGSHLSGPLEQLPMSMALILFNAATHPVLPWIFNSTSSQEDFEHATRNGWAFWAVCATLFGAGSYYLFGAAVQGVATQNIGLDLNMQPLQQAAGLADVSAAWLVLKLQTSLVPSSRPLLASLAARLGVELPAGNGGLRCALLSALVFGGVASLALCLESRLMEMDRISGAILMSANAFIFPSVAYICVCKPQGFSSMVGGVSVIVFGVALNVAVIFLSF